MDVERPHMYRYWDQLIEHIGSPDKIFNEKLVYPRQFEIHLPNDKKVPCNFDCFYCAGKKFIDELGDFEEEGLELIRNLNGRIPYHIYGGSYTEPLGNPYFMTYLNATKRYGSHFGIHTNGSLLKKLEDYQGWLKELSRISTDRVDYLSVSVDAGYIESHCKTKNIKANWLSDILEGIEYAVEYREKYGHPSVRMCYLMNEINSSDYEIESIVKFAKSVGVDSLRFSIPFAYYGQSFDVVRTYKKNIEQKLKNKYYLKISKYLSKNPDDKPFIFWMSPDLQDIELFNFEKCAYGYYQICLGADGYFYRCTTMSNPLFKNLRLGKVTSNLDEFNKMIFEYQDSDFSCSKCFDQGARCNRMGLEINSAWRDLYG